MNKSLVSFISGLIFSIGLGLSGMLQPTKIVGFLDLFGNWDPSLIFVMAGAIIVHALAYFFIKKKESPLLSPKFFLPSKTKIDRQLLLGAGLFGIGWGISGFCPGPGLVSLASGELASLIFVASMLIGMFAFNFYDKIKSNGSSHS